MLTVFLQAGNIISIVQTNCNLNDASNFQYQSKTEHIQPDCVIWSIGSQIPGFTQCVNHLGSFTSLSIPGIVISINGSSVAMICVTKGRTGNYDFRACARARGFPGSTRFGRTHTLRRVCRAIRDNSLRFLRKLHPDKMMEHIDHDYLSTQVIQIPYKSKTSFSSSFIFKKYPELSIPTLCLLCKMSYREVARESAPFLMTHLQISAVATTLK